MYSTSFASSVKACNLLSRLNFHPVIWLWLTQLRFWNENLRGLCSMHWGFVKNTVACFWCLHGASPIQMKFMFLTRSSKMFPSILLHRQLFLQLCFSQMHWKCLALLWLPLSFLQLIYTETVYQKQWCPSDLVQNIETGTAYFLFSLHVFSTFISSSQRYSLNFVILYTGFLYMVIIPNKTSSYFGLWGDY